MQTKTSAAPLLFGAIVIALIAGVTGWAMRSRMDTSPDAAGVATGAVPPPEQAMQRPTDGSQGRLSPAPTPSPLAEPMAQLAQYEAANAKAVDAGKQRLLSRYQGETVDKAWAVRKEKALERLSVSPQIEQANAEPLSFAAECRSSVCLIAADFPSRQAADDWFSLYTMNAGQEMTHAASDRSANPDGSVHLQIYGLTRGNL